MGSHKTCQYCDYCTDTDMRCMNTESQWAGCAVKPDNYCRLFELRSSLSLPEFRKYLIDLSIDGMKEDVTELYELLKAKEQGRIKFVKKPPDGACCGNCLDFIRIEGTARGTCRSQKRKRYGHHNEFRQVAQSTKACGAFKDNGDYGGREQCVPGMMVNGCYWPEKDLKCVFDKDMLILRRRQSQKYTWEWGSFRVKYNVYGQIESFQWVPDKKGFIRIRKKPEAGVPYVIGGDTAGTGNKSVDPDYFASQVLDNRTGEQVAVLHDRLDEREYAEQMYCLGHYYNEALIGVETNYSTYPEKKLEEFGYKNLYVRQQVDNYTEKVMESFGFETNLKTRPLIIDGLKDVFRYSPELITDFDTMGEMLTFIYAEGRRPQAEQGEHDDLVMSLAIAHFIRCQQRTTVETPQKQSGKKKWTADMWEDYNRADARMREYLMRIWGAD